MGHSVRSRDFSGALSAIVVVALIMATATMMLVTLNAKAAVAGLEPILIAGQHAEAGVKTGTVVALARPAERR